MGAKPQFEQKKRRFHWMLDAPQRGCSLGLGSEGNLRRRKTGDLQFLKRKLQLRSAVLPGGHAYGNHMGPGEFAALRDRADRADDGLARMGYRR
jgi:hypothetical protein